MSALDPAKELSQYVHDLWGDEKGFVGGGVNAICQTGDGYLWIGTERGLVRFDGVNFRLVQQPIADQPAVGPIRGLASDSEGNLWIRLDGRRLLRYVNGVFEDAIKRFNLPQMMFTAMAPDDGGGVLLSQLGNASFRYKDGRMEPIPGTENMPGTITSIAETRDHTLWFGTRDDGLYRVQDGQFWLVSRDPRERSINALAAANNGGLWIGTDHGLIQWDGNALLRNPANVSLANLQILSSTLDSEGNIWLGTNQGLVRLTLGGQASWTRLSRDPGSEITTTFVDREGALWYGGPRGVERLREGAFAAYTTAEGLPTDKNGAIYVDSSGRVWAAPLAGGLYWFKENDVGHVKLVGLDQDVVYSIAGDGGRIWLGRQSGGLTVLEETGGALTARSYRQSDGLAQNSVFSVMVASDHSVWAGTISGGISRFTDGKFRNYTTADGLSSNTINSIAEHRRGGVWAATPNGLDEFKEGRWVVHDTRDGLPSPDVRLIYEDPQGVLWIATTGGLAYYASGTFHVPRIPEPLREPVAGMAEDGKGSLWLVTSDHVFEVSREKMLAGSLTELEVRNYGFNDGLPGVHGTSRDRSMVSDNAHRIWLSVDRGLAMTNARLTMLDASPATVRIETVFAGGYPLNAAEDQLVAGPESKNITFVFGVMSLSNLDRYRFRYRLEGFDAKWSEPTNLRQVTYMNLRPREYRFEVMASNAAGLWNGPVTSALFTVKPAYWQTWWFRLLALVLFVLMLTTAYRLRMYQLVRRLNVRFQERLAERTRIAQELHDTLLQGVMSASLQLDLAEDQLPEDSPVKPRLQRVMELMSRVSSEGRNTLRGLRTAGDDNLSLEQAFSSLTTELAPEDSAKCRVVAISAARPVRPVIRDEVFRIGREALTNAFHHARAQNVEIEIEYATSFLRVSVRDDGCGIDAKTLDTGRDGHYGLIGMRERSEKIGGQLKLRSRIDGGTEVELTVPGTIAFPGNPMGSMGKRRWRI